jgi:hypothetical protein
MFRPYWPSSGIKCNLLWDFKFYVFNVRGWAVWPSSVACVDRTNEVCCGWQQYVHRFLVKLVIFLGKLFWIVSLTDIKVRCGNEYEVQSIEKCSALKEFKADKLNVAGIRLWQGNAGCCLQWLTVFTEALSEGVHRTYVLDSIYDIRKIFYMKLKNCRAITHWKLPIYIWLIFNYIYIYIYIYIYT